MENQRGKSSLNEKEENNENQMVTDIIEEVTKINGERVLKKYTRQGFLGKGGFAQCYMTYNKETNKRVATKIIPKKLLESPRTKLRLANEIKLHKSLHHQNIVEFYSNFEDEKNVYINLQLCQNGSINDLLQCRYELTTPQIQSFLYGLCQGVLYLHSRNIIHRDIKLGNLFLDAQNKVKIGDFGLASKLQFPHERKRTVCGTPNYIAPQILFGKGYHFQVDIWAIGIILFSVYFAFPPFQTEQAITTYQKIKKCDYSIPPIHRAPPEGVDLIKKILILDPHQRLTIDQILNHPFMKLGNGIPASLPNIIIKRAPSKKQLSLIPKIQRKTISVQKKKAEPFGVILQRKSSQKTLQIDISKMEATQLDSVGEKILTSQNVFAVFFEQVEQNLYFFCLNNGNFGLINSKRYEVYTKNIKDESKNQESCRLRRGSVNEKQKSDFLIREIPYQQCPYKPLFALRQKELKRSNLKINENASRDIDIAKISQHKELTMIKFANKILQLLFPQKDGFLFDSISRRLFYCHNFVEAEQIFEINLEQLQFSLEQKKENSNKKSTLMDRILKAGKIRKEKSVLTWKKLSYAAKIFEQGLVRTVKKRD